jgi:hypothetical protein
LQPLSLFYTFGTNQYNFGTSQRISAFRSLIDKVNAQVTLDSVKLHQVGAEIQERESTEKLHQAGAEMEFPPIFGFVPWRHHVEIVTKCKNVEEALFYVRKTIEDELDDTIKILNLFKDWQETLIYSI